jgi:ferredoxin
VDSGSDKGQAVIDKHPDLFKDAQEGQIEERKQNRAAITNKVDGQIKSQELTFADRLHTLMTEPKGPDVQLWTDFAATCVECGACNFICPTCHCFLLCDMEAKAGAKRFRNWDACQYKNFARVAGGANQRPRRAQRLHTRFDKKFKFFPERIEQYACTGCGRCVEACLGKIDLREILKELAK